MSTLTAKIAVLLSADMHPVSGRAMASRGDARALAFALKWGGATAVRALTVGAMPEVAAREFLAQGIASIERLPVSDTQLNSTVATLKEACQDIPWIVTGVHAGYAGHQWSSGLLPYALAEALQRPLIDRVVGIRAEGDVLQIEQALSKGARRHLTVTGPVVLTIHPAAPVTERYAAQAAAQGLIVDRGTLESLPEDIDARIAVRSHARIPLQAKSQKSGHARMLSAVGSSTGQSSTQVLKAGDVDEQARVVLDYLQQHGLLNI